MYVMIQTFINLVTGLAAGNITGRALKKNNAGMIINSVAGLTGGGLGGALISSLLNSGSTMNVGSVISGIAGSAATAVILTVIAGMIRSKKASRQ